MANKDKGKKETKKAPKPKAKVEPGRKREILHFAPAGEVGGGLKPSFTDRPRGPHGWCVRARPCASRRA